MIAQREFIKEKVQEWPDLLSISPFDGRIRGGISESNARKGKLGEKGGSERGDNWMCSQPAMNLNL